VNQLLALARAESRGDSLARQPCDLAEITMEVIHDSLPRAMDKHIDLGYEGIAAGTQAALIDGNPTLLKELVRNLLDNALGYTPSSASHPGVITARVLADPFGRVLLLQIEDSGPGIPQAERELVFQPFYRALGTNVDGSGLGLPIVVEIAGQHHASVELEDAHPHGATPGTRVSVRFSMGPATAQADL
jgi:two-component system sensor histidine kinase TctE